MVGKWIVFLTPLHENPHQSGDNSQKRSGALHIPQEKSNRDRSSFGGKHDAIDNLDRLFPLWEGSKGTIMLTNQENYRIITFNLMDEKRAESAHFTWMCNISSYQTEWLVARFQYESIWRTAWQNINSPSRYRVQCSIVSNWWSWTYLSIPPMWILYNQERKTTNIILTTIKRSFDKGTVLLITLI